MIAEALGDIGRPSLGGLAAGNADTAVRDGLLGGGALEAARQASELMATAPLPLYRLSKEAVPPGEAFRDYTELVDWRYLLLDGNQKAVAYSDVRDAEGLTKFVGVSEDRNAQFLQEATLRAEEFADRGTDDFELRLLSLPAVSLPAVWLANARDVFIPYADGYVSGNVQLRVLSSEQMVEEINRRISERNAANPSDGALKFQTMDTKEQTMDTKKLDEYLREQ